MTYKARTIIEGYKVRKDLIGKFLVAIPQHRLDKVDVVEYRDKVMSIIGKEIIEKLEFQDKFNRGLLYTLCYYEFIPELRQQQLSLI